MYCNKLWCCLLVLFCIIIIIISSIKILQINNNIVIYNSTYNSIIIIITYDFWMNYSFKEASNLIFFCQMFLLKTVSVLATANF